MRSHRLLIILRHHLNSHVYPIDANFLLGYIMTLVVVVDVDHGGVAFAFTAACERVWYTAANSRWKVWLPLAHFLTSRILLISCLLDIIFTPKSRNLAIFVVVGIYGSVWVRVCSSEGILGFLFRKWFQLTVGNDCNFIFLGDSRVELGDLIHQVLLGNDVWGIFEVHLLFTRWFKIGLALCLPKRFLISVLDNCGVIEAFAS